MSCESDVTAMRVWTRNCNLYCHQKLDEKGGRQKWFTVFTLDRHFYKKNDLKFVGGASTDHQSRNTFLTNDNSKQSRWHFTHPPKSIRAKLPSFPCHRRRDCQMQSSPMYNVHFVDSFMLHVAQKQL